MKANIDEVAKAGPKHGDAALGRLGSSATAPAESNAMDGISEGSAGGAF